MIRLTTIKRTSLLLPVHGKCNDILSPPLVDVGEETCKRNDNIGIYSIQQLLQARFSNPMNETVDLQFERPFWYHLISSFSFCCIFYGPLIATFNMKQYLRCAHLIWFISFSHWHYFPLHFGSPENLNHANNIRWTLWKEAKNVLNNQQCIYLHNHTSSKLGMCVFTFDNCCRQLWIHTSKVTMSCVVWYASKNSTSKTVQTFTWIFLQEDIVWNTRRILNVLASEFDYHTYIWGIFWAPTKSF